ncbi:MAG: flagellar hook protein FlgE [Alphaproteobacteria bacterium]|nr:flagellar hook protein FlgE [Alphaproteobacteria bacterium]
MGIFGALTTAVTGMRAQSFALENVSGNIANSQTTAFKRMDTSFTDLIPDQTPSKQVAGSVFASARMTNTVQGDIQATSIGTFMAVNGAGFFVVEKPSSFVDNRPVFDGIDRYTRRGDFQPDKSGFMVNGAGNYLMGIPIDPTTGNLIGSVPQLLQFQNDFLPAQATSQIEYRANLASYPLTPNHDSSVPRSELLDPANFSANPVAGAPQPAKIIGTGATLSPDAVAVLTGTADLSAISSVGGNLVINGTTIAIAATDDFATIRGKINAQTGTTGVTATASAANHLVLTSADADTAVTIGGASTLALLNETGLAVGTEAPSNLLTQSAVAAGQTLVITIGSNPPTTITFGTGAGQVSTMAELATAIVGITGGAGALNTSNGNLTITAASLSDTITVGGTATALSFGMRTLTALPSNQVVVANDLSTFLDSSIGGGAVTAYDVSGSPVNIQLRWAKIDSASYGGTDTWNLFYQTDSLATGTQVAWQNAGVDYTFSANGQMNPAIPNLTLANVTVNGITLGNVQLVHGTGGITQFADPNGNAQVNLLQQNGFPAGELQEVSVSDKGRIVGSYSNGRTIDLAEITLANFNGANSLKRIDGGAFEVTDESGPAIYGAPGKIVGSSLEGANTDIADEFTKLIVTQQAYSANTRVISTANSMVQDLLNMLR